MNLVNKTFQEANLQCTKHSKYFEIYEKIFHDLYEKNLTIVEIGVLHGGSLEVYKKLFKNSRIIGIDKNPKVKQLEQYGFEIFIADQADFNEMNKVFGEIYLTRFRAQEFILIYATESLPAFAKRSVKHGSKSADGKLQALISRCLESATRYLHKSKAN